MKFITKIFSLSYAILISYAAHCSSLVGSDQEEGAPQTGPVVTYNDIKHLSPDANIHPITVDGRVWSLQWHSSRIGPIEDDYSPEDYEFHVVLCSDKGLKSSKIEDLQFASYRMVVEKRETKEIIDPLLYVFYLRVPR
tara:strand:+ start:1140 stop:1553 length:414 start_codon:yes stop_codon:yes gene_type:complete